MNEHERSESFFFLKKDGFGYDFFNLFKKEIQNLRKDSFQLDDFESFGTIADPHICSVGPVLTPILFGYSNVRLIPEKKVAHFEKRKDRDKYGDGDDRKERSSFESSDVFQLTTACLYIDNIVLFLIRSVSIRFFLSFLFTVRSGRSVELVKQKYDERMRSLLFFIVLQISKRSRRQNIGKGQRGRDENRF
jgi:hypothetical protein